MKNFIFVTDEGITFQPNSKSITPDIENLQVIGFSTGLDSNDAFDNLLKIIHIGEKLPFLKSGVMS